MKIRDILRHKGPDVVTVSGAQTVMDAVRVLVERNIGGVVVVDGEQVVGILTERDVLRLTAEGPEQLTTVTVETAMTRDVITGSLDDELHSVMEIMTEHRIRHLPVMDEDRLAGIVSIGDVVNASRRLAEEENVHLRDYMHGTGG